VIEGPGVAYRIDRVPTRFGDLVLGDRRTLHGRYCVRETDTASTPPRPDPEPKTGWAECLFAEGGMAPVLLLALLVIGLVSVLID
jgi:hypothetical protein